MQILAKYFALLTTVTALLATAHAAEHETTERVYADEHGVIRWTADDREVALFGANYLHYPLRWNYWATFEQE